MYVLNEFVKMVTGNNGVWLYNNLNNTVLDLNKEQGIELQEILENGTPTNKKSGLLDSLLKKELIKYSDKIVGHNEINLFNVNQVQFSNFKLSKVIIELSTSCMLNCFYCNEEGKTYTSCTCKKWRKKEDDDINYDDMVSQMLRYSLDKIMVIGGDVFFDAFDKLSRLMVSLKENCYEGEIVIVTNGTCIKKSQIDFLKHFPNVRLDLIIHGGDEKSYYDVTNVKNAYKRVKKNLISLKRNKIRVNGTYLINNRNISKFPYELMEMGMNIGIKYVYNEQYTNMELLLDYKGRMMSNDAITTEALEDINCCLFGQVFISSDMKVYPCPNMRDFMLGDLKKDKLFEIFCRDEYKRFWYLSKSKIDGCKDCKYRTCCFDCRAIEYSVMKDLYKEYYCGNK
jgi:radical SAM protein with 4Fe4S-binding SPASM domain